MVKDFILVPVSVNLYTTAALGEGCVVSMGPNLIDPTVLSGDEDGCPFRPHRVVKPVLPRVCSRLESASDPAAFVLVNYANTVVELVGLVGLTPNTNDIQIEFPLGEYSVAQGLNVV